MAIGANVSFEGDPNGAGDAAQRIFGSTSGDAYDPFGRYREAAAARVAGELQPLSATQRSNNAQRFSRDVALPGRGPAPAALSADAAKSTLERARELAGGGVQLAATAYAPVALALVALQIGASAAQAVEDTRLIQRGAIELANRYNIQVNTQGFGFEPAQAAVGGVLSGVAEGIYGTITRPLVQVGVGTGLLESGAVEEYDRNFSNATTALKNLFRQDTINEAVRVAREAAAQEAYQSKRGNILVLSGQALSEYDIPPRLLAEDLQLERLADEQARAFAKGEAERAEVAAKGYITASASPQ